MCCQVPRKITGAAGWGEYSTGCSAQLAGFLYVFAVCCAEYSVYTISARGIVHMGHFLTVFELAT